jgi:hypothetical protein
MGYSIDEEKAAKVKINKVNYYVCMKQRRKKGVDVKEDEGVKK